MEVNLICKMCGKKHKRIYHSDNDGYGKCRDCGGKLVRRSAHIEKRNEKARKELTELGN